jgi:S1-C subfamily serine protease
MEHPGCLLVSRPTQTIVSLLAAWVVLLSMAAAEPLVADFPALPGGRSCRSAVVPVDGKSLLVTVAMPGAKAAEPVLQAAGSRVQARVIGHDPVSRLVFLRAEGTTMVKPAQWLGDARGSVGGTLHAVVDGKKVKCQATGWVKQVGGKVLPLALLQVTFNAAVPPPGTPLMDAGNRVAAVVFQSVGSRTCYAIPAEAVHRVRRDVSESGGLKRGWLGLTLDPASRIPRVLRVLPDSPASNAGVMKGDVLSGVGSRPVAEYADAVNAFFYLMPGEAVQVRLMRASQTYELSLTPGGQPQG